MSYPGFDTYQCYNAMTLHFNKSVPYDYFKYNGKSKVSEESFKKHSRRYLFQSLERKYNKTELIILFYGYLRANSYRPKINTKHMEAEKTILLKEYQDYFDDSFEHDIEKVKTFLSSHTLDASYLYKNYLDSNYPLIYQMLIDNLIDIKTFEIFDAYMMNINKSMSVDTIMWPVTVDNISSSRGFNKIVMQKYEKNIKKLLTDLIRQHKKVT